MVNQGGIGDKRSPVEPRRNVELKARCANLERAREIAVALGARAAGVLEQRDTYFHVPRDRLKLREIVGEPAVLIGYDRPNELESRLSRYYLVEVPDPAGMIGLLSATLGVRGVVEKSRDLLLYQNVRIHLDRVRGLGTFLEFEVVLRPDQSVDEGHTLLAELRQRFGIVDADLVSGSYGELVLELAQATHRLEP